MLAMIVMVFLVVVAVGAVALAAGISATALGPATFVQSLTGAAAVGALLP